MNAICEPSLYGPSGLRIGQAVKSKIHGFGQVACHGDPPTIRFLAGPEVKLARREFDVIPNEALDAEVANRNHIEAALVLMVYGRRELPRDGQFWRKDTRGVWTPHQDFDESPCPSAYLDPDDLGRRATVNA